MATHKVHFTLPSRELGKADVSFAVRKDDDKFGELKVSNGSAVWFRADGKKAIDSAGASSMRCLPSMATRSKSAESHASW